MFSSLITLLKKTALGFDFNDSFQFPPISKLNENLSLTNDNHKQLKFVSQNKSLPFFEMGYEERIFQHGIIATRENNWHDFFNALIWLQYPQTKSALNAIHFKELQLQTGSQRSKVRDILTLFDECGVVVFADDVFLSMIKHHQWNELFVNHRQAWLSGEIKIITFGHAMYEKYLNPYIGMTAKALLVSDEVSDLDTFLKNRLENEQILQTKSELAPLPVLGIPNWHVLQDNSFYANKQYFR